MSDTSSHKKAKTQSSTADVASDKQSGDNTTAAAGVSDTASDIPAAAAPKKHPRTKHGKGGGIWLTLLILLLMAGSGAGGYFLWLNLQDTQQRLSADSATLRQDLETLTSRTEQLEQQAGRAKQIERQVSATLPESISALKDRQQTLEEAFGKLRSEVGDARTWTIEEIATLLQIANDRLHLEDNIAASLAALQAADQHIQELKNPEFLDIRRLIAEEITALQTTANPDITGMALSLDALIKEIDRLPVSSSATVQEAAPAALGDEKGWRGVLHDFWEKLKSLVVIKRRGEAERPLLAPDERYFLHQNLRLKLESARLALLRRDDQLYQNTLSSAQEWITLYFDEESPAGAGALKELDRLQHIDIAPKLPDISASLNALQSWLKQHRQQLAAEPTAEVTQP